MLSQMCLQQYLTISSFFLFTSTPIAFLLCCSYQYVKVYPFTIFYILMLMYFCYKTIKLRNAMILGCVFAYFNTFVFPF